MKRIASYGGVRRTGRVYIERASTFGQIVRAGGVIEKCINRSRRIGGTGRVLVERSIASGGIAVGRVVLQCVGASSSVVTARRIRIKRSIPGGRVFRSFGIGIERLGAGSSVASTGCVGKERLRSGGGVVGATGIAIK